MDRRSTLDKKVAVLPLLCAAALLLATFWTHPADTARLRLNSAVCTILVITLLALRWVEWDNTSNEGLQIFHNHGCLNLVSNVKLGHQHKGRMVSLL